MENSKKLPASDDEEDLEILRLAALRTIKKKNSPSNGLSLSLNSPQRSPDKMNRYNRSQNKDVRNRYFGVQPIRAGKKGHFSRNRNPNLIPIPTLGTEDEKVKEKSVANITLPQHRYCGGNEEVKVSKEEETSKFDRYNKSDESESESDEEEEVGSESDSPGKLHKADSLEALMQELDDEIQGKSKPKEAAANVDKPKAKKSKKKKSVVSESAPVSSSDIKTSEIAEQKLDKVEVIRDESDKTKNSEVVDGKIEVKQSSETKPAPSERYSPARKRARSRSPVNRRGFSNRRRPRNYHKFQAPPLQNLPFLPLVNAYPPPVIPFANQPFNPLFAPPNVTLINHPPPFFERPLSPLLIGTDPLPTSTLAPLSPRSAAFVLQNKAIVESRKRSPRRSYSRSPSRSPRRSPSPRRRSISPRRVSRSPRRFSRSPRRRSLSPRKRSASPRRKNLSRTTENSPKNKASVRERLGLKNKTEDKAKEARTSPKKDEKPLDPVLEARKRKFETNEIKMREGIIRLKPKEEKPAQEPNNSPVPAPVKTVPVASSKTTETAAEDTPGEPKDDKSKELDVVEELENLLKEEALLEGDDIDLLPKVADIFSDEDSASDNEGRFKVKEREDAKPPVLSFAKLVNGEKREIKEEPLLDSSRRSQRRRERFNRLRNKPRTTAEKEDSSKEPKAEEKRRAAPKKGESQEKAPASKSRISLKGDRHITPRFERKIEIKIKNPSKYERGGGKSRKEEERLRDEAVKRKVELGEKEDVKVEEEEEEEEIIVENDSGDEENSIVNEGDLRAQLSKKRAEKLHRIPVEGVSSRLLQNALQGAVFKKSKKKFKESHITSNDGKLPIHLRLGVANNSDIFSDVPVKPKRKSRKRKNREVLEQVYYILLRDYLN